MPNPVNLASPSAFTRIFDGLRSLWIEAAPVELREGRRDGDSQAEKVAQLHRRAELLVERLAGGIFEHQHGSATLADQRQRPHGPSPVQLILQRVFVREPIEADGV